eukprot:scaffold250948_cov33-Prasinocladus_malaysianus.AAC.1
MSLPYIPLVACLMTAAHSTHTIMPCQFDRQGKVMVRLTGPAEPGEPWHREDEEIEPPVIPGDKDGEILTVTAFIARSGVKIDATSGTSVQELADADRAFDQFAA